jgi:GDP-L-fucose synthase
MHKLIYNNISILSIKMKKILITGGAGFVGRRFVKYFLDKNHKVIVVDNLAKLTGGLHPKKWPLFNPMDYKNFHFYNNDCRDWFKKNNQSDFDYVLHLAAMVGGREVIENNPLAVADLMTLML